MKNSRRLGCLITLISFPLFVIVCLTVLGLFIIPYNNICNTERKALAGDAEEERVLAINYQYALRSPECSIGRFAPDKGKAMYWMEAAAKGGDWDAILHLPELYEADFPGQRDDDVVRWYINAARHGSANAAKRLADIYNNGLLGQSHDKQKAAYWHRIGETMPPLVVHEIH